MGAEQPEQDLLWRRPGKLERIERVQLRSVGGDEVLQPAQQPFALQLEARLDEQLLGERVADLNRRTLRLRGFLELLRREDRRTADSVASCLRAEQQRNLAGSLRSGAQDLVV